MGNMHGLGWQRTTVDRVIVAGAAILHRILLLVSVTGGDATLYEGQDPTSGRVIARCEAIADETRVIEFGGLYCPRGIYVDIGSNVTEVTVIYEPVEEVA